jgi:four helix bundle protein
MIVRHQDLDVYKKAFAAAMQVFELSRDFPKEETYSLTDQIRRSSRSVCANLAEAWRKRRYEAAFVSKLNDAEAEAAESQTWLEFGVRCKYLSRDVGKQLFKDYDEVISILVTMINASSSWVLPSGTRRRRMWGVRESDKKLFLPCSLTPLVPYYKRSKCHKKSAS